MKLKETITRLLSLSKPMRDDKLLLIKTVIGAYEFEKEISLDRKINIILRCDRYWRLVQQENEHLRGEKWIDRQRRKEEVAKEIKTTGTI